MNAKDELLRLKSKLDSGEITQEDYLAKKAAALDELLKADDSEFEVFAESNPRLADAVIPPLNAGALNGEAQLEQPQSANQSATGKAKRSIKKWAVASVSAVAVIAIALVACFVFVVNKDIGNEQIEADFARIAGSGTLIKNDYVNPSEYQVANLDVLSIEDGANGTRNVECRAHIENDSFSADVKLMLIYLKDGFDWIYQDYRQEDVSAKAIAGVSKVDGASTGTVDFDAQAQTCTYTYTPKSLPSNWLVEAESAGDSAISFTFEGNKWVKGDTVEAEAKYSSPYIGETFEGVFGDQMGLNSTKDATLVINSLTVDGTDSDSGDIEAVLSIQYPHEFDPKSETPTGEVSQSDMHLYDMGLMGFVTETREESRTYRGHYQLDGDDFELTIADGDTGEFLTRTVTAHFSGDEYIYFEIGSAYAAKIWFE